MRLPLICHPAAPAGLPLSIEVEAERTGLGLALTYAVSGDIARLYVPATDTPARTDELWKRTCFETFVQPAGEQRYWEFNLSPSTRWAAYRFTGYRQGMADLDVPAPVIAMRRSADRLELAARVTLPADAASADWRVGLTAVIEEQDGRISYWAIAQAQPRPEFHDAATWVADLPK